MKHPCIGCIYFDTCGDPERTMPCDGRETTKMEKMDFTSDIFSMATN